MLILPHICGSDSNNCAVFPQDVACVHRVCVRSAVRHLWPPTSLHGVTWHDQHHQHGPDHVDGRRGLVFLLCLKDWCTCLSSCLLSSVFLFRFFPGGCEFPECAVGISEVPLWDPDERPPTAWHVSLKLRGNKTNLWFRITSGNEFCHKTAINAINLHAKILWLVFI